MESILGYLDSIEDILESCKPSPFTGKITVDKDKIYEIIDEIRLNIPNEIRQAQRVITDHDKIILDAKNKATMILKEAEERGQRLTDDHEIYKQAIEEGNKIIEDSKKSARDMRLNAMDYADEILAKTEEIVREAFDSINRQNHVTDDFFNTTIDVIYNNRVELRGSKK